MNDMRKYPNWVRWVMVALLLLGFALRIHRLGDRAVWWDEGWSVWMARHSLFAIAQETAHDVHPPLYFWLLHGWRRLLGDTEFALRLLSAVFGTLGIAAAYLLGKVMSGRTVGVLAALFLTVSRFHIVWSQEIRMYALAGLLALLAAWAAIRVWEAGEEVPLLKKVAIFSVYIIFTTAGLLTLYLYFPIPVAINIAFLWDWRHRKWKWRMVWGWMLAQTAVLIFIILWLQYALRGFLSNSSATPISVIDFLKIYWTVLVMGVPLNVDGFARFTLPVLAIFMGGTAVLLHQSRKKWRMARGLTLLLVGLLLPIAVVIYVTIPKAGAYAPPFSPRYLVIFSGYFVILSAWGIKAIGKTIGNYQWGITAVLSSIILYVSWVGMHDYHRGRVLADDYGSMTATLAAHVGADDGVILYADRDWPIFAYHYADDWNGVPSGWDMNVETAVSYLAPLWQTYDGLWLVTTPYGAATDPDGTIPAWLAENAIASKTWEYGDKALTFYAKTDERAKEIGGVNGTAVPQFSSPFDGLPFLGYDLPTRTYHTGDTVRLGTYWASNKGAHTIQFVDKTGGVWGKEIIRLGDLGVVYAPPVRHETIFTIPADAPSGTYEMMVDSEPIAHMQIRQRSQNALTAIDVDIENRLNVRFENGAQLLGYAIENETITAGKPLHLTLYWQTDIPITGTYKVFTHLLGEVWNAETGNFLWGQQDNEPVNGKRPLSTWRTGELIVDSYAMPTALNGVNGRYTLEIGLYNPVTGIRLLTEDGSDHILLSPIEIGGQ